MKNNYFQKIVANRAVLAYFAALGVMFLALLFALNFVLEAHANAEATERKVEMMRKATETYDQKKAILSRMTAKPITSDKIDEVQTNILLQIQRHQLSLANLNSVSQESKEKNRIFEMDISGSYDNTMAFLSSFRKDSKALISVLSVHFNPDKENLKTRIKYKVYVR